MSVYVRKVEKTIVRQVTHLKEKVMGITSPSVLKWLQTCFSLCLGDELIAYSSADVCCQ